MNKSAFLIFIFLVFSFFSFSQSNNFPFFNNLKGDRKVFADTAILRVAPSTGAATADTLFLGENISILMTVPYSEVRNNIVSPWLKITYKKGAFTKVGFVSAIDIALNEKISFKDVDLVIGLEKSNKKDSLINNQLTINSNYWGKVKNIKKNKKTSEVLIEIPHQMKVDSIVSIAAKKVKLNGSLGLVQMDVVSTNDSTLVYQYNFIVCNKNKISQLEVINNFQKVNPDKRPIKSYYVFDGNKILYKVSGFMEGDKTIDIYKWKDCSFIKAD